MEEINRGHDLSNGCFSAALRGQSWVSYACMQHGACSKIRVFYAAYLLRLNNVMRAR